MSVQHEAGNHMPSLLSGLNSGPPSGLGFEGLGAENSTETVSPQLAHLSFAEGLLPIGRTDC